MSWVMVRKLERSPSAAFGPWRARPGRPERPPVLPRPASRGPSVLGEGVQPRRVAHAAEHEQHHDHDRGLDEPVPRGGLLGPRLGGHGTAADGAVPASMTSTRLPLR